MAGDEIHVDTINLFASLISIPALSSTHWIKPNNQQAKVQLLRNRITQDQIFSITSSFGWNDPLNCNVSNACSSEHWVGLLFDQCKSLFGFYQGVQLFCHCWYFYDFKHTDSIFCDQIGELNNDFHGVALSKHSVTSDLQNLWLSRLCPKVGTCKKLNWFWHNLIFGRRYTHLCLFLITLTVETDVKLKVGVTLKGCPEEKISRWDQNLAEGSPAG